MTAGQREQLIEGVAFAALVVVVIGAVVAVTFWR